MRPPHDPSLIFLDSDDLSAVALAKEEGVPFVVARKAFGNGPKPVIEELNEVLVA